jgi:hypothetical protein
MTVRAGRAGGAAAAIAFAVCSVGVATRADAQDAAPASRVSQLVRSVETASARVQRLLSDARASGEVDRVACVDGRLSEIHSNLRLALERSERFHQAAERGDGIHARRERELVTRLASRVRELERQARECVDPEPMFEAGTTRVVVTVEPWVPEMDVSAIPEPRRDFR